MKQLTTIVGRDGIEYVVSGGKLVEKCYHKTVTDKSSGKISHKVCHDCGKTLVYNSDITPKIHHDSIQEFSNNFRAMHGRDPKGSELSILI